MVCIFSLGEMCLPRWAYTDVLVVLVCIAGTQASLVITISLDQSQVVKLFLPCHLFIRTQWLLHWSIYVHYVFQCLYGVSFIHCWPQNVPAILSSFSACLILSQPKANFTECEENFKILNSTKSKGVTTQMKALNEYGWCSHCCWTYFMFLFFCNLDRDIVMKELIQGHLLWILSVLKLF